MAKPNQNPERYSSTGGGWQVSAQADFKTEFPNSTKEIPPIPIGKGPGLPGALPLLQSDGYFVMLDGQPLASPNTISTLAQNEADNNPHHSPVPRDGSIKGKAIGGDIPILPVSTAGFVDMGNKWDELNRKAGVKSVDYLYEGGATSGIPTNLLNQINYTLTEELPRPADTFEVYDLRLGGDYTIQQLVIATKQGDNFLDRQKLETFMTEVGGRLRALRDDFNAIKRTFFDGAVPPNNGATSYTQVASTDPPESDHQVVTKDTQLVGMV